ncbi:Cold shock domain-containing protein E1, partial [Bonamia ostreae]
MFSVGDNVAFSVNIDRQNGRLYANNVRSIPTGSVIFEELLENEGRKKAVVTKEIGADSIGDGRTRFSGELRVEKDGETLRFRRRDLESKQIKLLKGDKVEISVFVDKKTRRRGATQIVLKEPSLENREYGVVGAIINSSYGFIKCADRNDPKLFFHFSERLQEDYFPKEGDNIAFNVTKDRNDQLCAMRLELVSPESVKFVKILRPIFNGTIMTSLKWFPKEERWEEGQITFKTTLVNRQVNEFLPFE